MSKDAGGIEGVVTWELRDENGEIKRTGRSYNLITDTGDTMYAHRGSGAATPPAAPTGMQLGTGSTAVAKTGAGAALVTYLPNSDHAFDGSGGLVVTPAASNSGAVVTYKCTYAANEATSAGAITEAVISNKTLVANGAAGGSASTATQTIARVLLTGIGSKGASDTLTVQWTHTIKGA